MRLFDVGMKRLSMYTESQIHMYTKVHEHFFVHIYIYIYIYMFSIYICTYTCNCTSARM